MTPVRWRDFPPGVKMPSTWTDGIEALITNYVSPNFRLVRQTSTTVRIPAGSGDDVVSAAVDGRPHWIESNLDMTHPGGAAGTYPLFVTAAADSFSTIPIGQPNAGGEQDDTDRAFYGRITAIGGTPTGSGTQAIWRQVASIVWDGAAITQIIPIVGLSAIGQVSPHAAQHALGGMDPLGAASVDVGMLMASVLDILLPVGAMFPWAGSGDLSASLVAPDGRLLTIASYPALDALCGAGAPVGHVHKYNGGVAPGGGQLRISDKRGRGPMGAINFGTAAGAGANSNARSQLAAGATAGEVLHLLLAAESGLPAHSPAVTVNAVGDHAHLENNPLFNASVLFNNTGAHIATDTPNRYNDHPATGAGGAHSHTATSSVGAANAASSHNNVHPVETDCWLMRVK